MNSFYAREKQDASDVSWSNLNQHDQHEFSSNYTMNPITYRKFVDAVNIEFFEKGSRTFRDLIRSRTRPRRYYRWLPSGTIPWNHLCTLTIHRRMLYNKARYMPREWSPAG